MPPSKNRYFSISQLAQITGKDRATLAKRLENCKPYQERKNAKIYDAHEVLPIIFAAENFKGMSKKIEQVSYEIEKEKLRKVRMENERRSGQLVEIDEVARVVEKEYIFIRAQFKSIPSRLSKPLSMESDPLIVNKVLTETIDEILMELVSDENYSKFLESSKFENNPTLDQSEQVENEIKSDNKFITESTD